MGDMINTSYDSERQAGLYFANPRQGWAVQSGPFFLVVGPTFNLSSALSLEFPAALFRPGCCGEKCGQTKQVFFFSLSVTGFLVVLLMPLYLFVQHCIHTKLAAINLLLEPLPLILDQLVSN